MNDPIFIEVKPSELLSDVVKAFESYTGKTIQQGQPEYAICSAIAYRESLMLNRLNFVGKSQLVDYATYPILDKIASLVGVSRLQESKATCTLRFNIIQGHLQVLLPLGTRVASSDGNAVFETLNDVTIPVGVNSVDVSAICKVAGKSGNGYDIGAISVIQDPYAFVTSVSNIDKTSGGSDEETDEELRERIKIAPSSFSVAGPTEGYKFWTYSANQLIKDVKILTHSDDSSIAYGEVHAYSLLEDGQIPTTAINDQILAVLNDEKIRPLTDTVKVFSPTLIEYSLKIDVVKTKEANTTITNRINENVSNYVESQKLKLGADIVKNKIEALSMVDGVYDVTATITSSVSLVSGNLPVSSKEVAHCTGIVINITGDNE